MQNRYVMITMIFWGLVTIGCGEGFSVTPENFEAYMSSEYTSDDKDSLLFQKNVHGTSGNDFIKGTRYNDKLYGGTGNDLILAGRGNDLVYGGDGDDRLNGGPGTDFLYGGRGNDTYVVKPNHGAVYISDTSGNMRIVCFNHSSSKSGAHYREMQDQLELIVRDSSGNSAIARIKYYSAIRSRVDLTNCVN